MHGLYNKYCLNILDFIIIKKAKNSLKKLDKG